MSGRQRGTIKNSRADLARAGILHRDGRLDEAVAIYRDLLRQTPGAFDVARVLILALLQSGRVKEAHAAARKARDGHRSNSHAHLLMGAVLQAEQKWERALAAFEHASQLDQGLAEAHYLCGKTLLRLDRPHDAVDRFERVLALDPSAAEALALRASALMRLSRPLEALADCDRLIEMQPLDARHPLARARALLQLGQPAQATAAAQAALRLAPRLAEAHFLRGQGLAAQNDVSGARAAFADAVTAEPDSPAFQAALIRTERQLGDLDAARARAEKVVSRLPGAVAVWQELAEVRRALEDPAGAREAVEKALAADAKAPSALTVKARLHLDADRPAKARVLAEKALATDPSLPMARYLRACDELAEGRWESGWADYESRPSLPPPLPFARWDGRSTPARLIVVGEQEVGDLILFGRLLRLLADRGVPTTLLTTARHAPLVARMDARVEVITDPSRIDETVPGLFWVPLASLPGLISPDPAHWPRAPYLIAPPERVARARAAVGEAFTLGISWQGDALPMQEMGRAVPLDLFAPLAALDGVELVSLQQGAGAQQLDDCLFAGRIARLGPDWDEDGTFLDTAGLLQHLDLVVTADTALAHLAGARARPAIVALKAAPDWRWGRAGDRSAFYPSLTLARQETSGDFAGLFRRIARMVADRKRGETP
ncbi:tetratricopeptide repeat protein [Xanthobacter sp. KR7-65]|uniref:tetratricopeptide repeat protein n=1 Tax=Xanthobacter sp. KR7-65 TaxID=3156612 RepID=UPI0032B3DB97